MRQLWSVALAVLALGFACPRASAETPRAAKRRTHSGAKRPTHEPVTQDASVDAERGRPISVGLLLGYGHSLEGESVNPWGVGFGARGGYNMGPVFAGARFVFYAGEEPSSVWELGLDAGVDLRAGLFSARPGVGFGIASVTLEAGPTGMESETELYLAPGLTLLFDVTRDVFVGLEGRFQIIFADPEREAFITLANAGMRF